MNKKIIIPTLSVIMLCTSCTTKNVQSSTSNQISGYTYLVKNDDYYTLSIEAYYTGNAEEIHYDNDSDLTEKLDKLEVKDADRTLNPKGHESRCGKSTGVSFIGDSTLYITEDSYDEAKKVLEDFDFEFSIKKAGDTDSESIKTKLEFLD